MAEKLIVLLIAAAVLLSGCAAVSEGSNGVESQDGTGGRLKIAATIFPQYDFARTIAGGMADVIMLLPPGSESHTFDPMPGDIVSLGGCGLFIMVGGGADMWAEELAENLGGGAAVLSLTDIVSTVQEEITEGMQDAGHDGGGEADAHVWTSPVNAMAIVRAICDSMCALDEKNAAYYSNNAENLIKDISELDSKFREAVNGADRRVMVFADRFPFRYFADEYGLEYFAAFPGCAPESEPSAKTVAFLTDKVKNEGVPAVFYIEFSSQKLADTIIEGTNAKKLLFHSCHNVTKDDFDGGVTYLQLMERNLSALKEALYD